MPLDYAFGIFESFENRESDFGAKCDPDGDGTGPDTPATFDEETGAPICPEGSVFEFDLNPAELNAAGDGTHTGANDVEHSGLRSREGLAGGSAGLSEDGHEVKFNRPSSKKGYRYLCSIHGPFMSGRVRVKG